MVSEIKIEAQLVLQVQANQEVHHGVGQVHLAQEKVQVHHGVNQVQVEAVVHQVEVVHQAEVHQVEEDNHEIRIKTK